MENAPHAKPSTMDVDLAQLPPVVRTLAQAAHELPDNVVQAEAHTQWPNLYGKPGWFGWFPEVIQKARDHIKGYVVGIALGVTKLEAPPVTAVVQAAVDVDRAVSSPEWHKARDKRARRAAKRRKESQALGGSNG